jgi:hypothetical protein
MSNQSESALPTESSLLDYYQGFIDEVVDTELVWGLFNGEDWAVCESEDFPGREVILFFSSEAKAAKLAVEEWADYEATPIDPDEFIDEWLHGMHEDEVLAGTNWDEALVGPEIEPVKLIDDLLDEDYE